MVALVNWFQQHRSKAVAASQLGYALGGLALPLMAFSIQVFGWRSTAFVSGFIVIATCLPLSWMVRHRPSDIGEQMDGAPPPAEDAIDQVQTQQEFTANQAVRTSAFWLLSAGHAFALLAVSSVLLHAIPHMHSGLGFSLVKAAGMVSVVMACQILGQMIGGYLGDRYDKRYICIMCMIGHTSALLLLAFASNDLMVIAFAIIHGVSWGARGPLMVALRADYFGTRAFGMIMGISSLVVMLGMMGGPIVGGLLSDHYGNFVYSFAIIAMVSLLGAICFYFATLPSPPPSQT
jgi:MFS family permease